MPYRQAKFCLDENHVRWSLLEGVITRKEQHHGPTEGEELHIRQVTGLEKTSLKRVHRSRMGGPVTLFAVALLVLSGWVATLSWLGAIPGLLLGFAGLYWGVKRIPPRTEILEAHLILAPGIEPERWRVVGSISEVEGFLQGLRIELGEKEKEQAAAVEG